MKYTMGLLKVALGIFADLSVKGHKNSGTVLFDHLEFHAENFTDSLELWKIILEMIPPVQVEKLTEIQPDHLFPTISQSIDPGLIYREKASVFVKRLTAELRPFVALSSKYILSS